jgi:hypothetical protein
MALASHHVMYHKVLHNHDTYTETDTHENDAVLQKRPESYQNKVKHVILPKENQKKVNYFEESNNKLPTPIRVW